ncbi:hypothetical protein ABBQ38_005507 [Trebouxia sp. C0009 RCD-2024]
MSLTSKQCRVLTPVAAVRPKPRACSARVHCNAAMQPVQHTSRREALGLILALPLLAAGRSAQAADITDSRQHKEALDSLDQARSDTEAYGNRFSMQGGSANLSLEEHKARVRESFARLQSDVKEAIDAKAYPRVQADLRHQLGTLSFDLNKIAQAQGDKAARKQSAQLQRAAMDSLAQLDYSARRKNDVKLQEAYSEAVKAVGDAVSSLA